VLEAVTDPEVAPLPPHVMPQQARNLAKGMVKGEAAAAPIARQSLRGKLAELLNR
jgi:pyruvate dehydrogenase (quinone)